MLATQNWVAVVILVVWAFAGLAAVGAGMVAIRREIADAYVRRLRDEARDRRVQP